MKTAQIIIYTVWGTPRRVADVTYRGQLLASFDRRHIDPSQPEIIGLEQAARQWAMSIPHGFTTTKTTIQP
jgi:hypothetical protein